MSYQGLLRSISKNREEFRGKEDAYGRMEESEVVLRLIGCLLGLLAVRWEQVEKLIATLLYPPIGSASCSASSAASLTPFRVQKIS